MSSSPLKKRNQVPGGQKGFWGPSHPAEARGSPGPLATSPLCLHDGFRRKWASAEAARWPLAWLSPSPAPGPLGPDYFGSEKGERRGNHRLPKGLLPRRSHPKYSCHAAQSRWSQCAASRAPSAVAGGGRVRGGGVLWGEPGLGARGLGTKPPASVCSERIGRSTSRRLRS